MEEVTKFTGSLLGLFELNDIFYDVSQWIDIFLRENIFSNRKQLKM